jgi:hypothetical protein
MAANNYFQEYLVFRTRDLDADRVPRRCVVCEVNPSLFAYEKRMDSRSVRKESGYCCTSCAFNMLVKLANEETRSLAALTRTSARRRNGDRILSETVSSSSWPNLRLRQEGRLFGNSNADEVLTHPAARNQKDNEIQKDAG